jgi:ATP-dependent Clp protease adaptor protein ClpS
MVQRATREAIIVARWMLKQVQHDECEGRSRGFRTQTVFLPLPFAPQAHIFRAKMHHITDFQIRMAEDGDDDRRGDDPSVGLATRTRTRTKQPTPYRVLMLNDDYTPMEFVVLVLQRFFKMDMEAATRVMLAVHQRGVGVCGVFTYEVAETKVSQVIDFARQNQHPLQCTMEKA